MRAIVATKHGGPDVLTLREVEDPLPEASEVLIRVEAAGVNFIDTYHRSGSYPGSPPFTPGVEGAGEVVAVGDDVTDVQIGDRVAWAGPRGAYAELQAVPADRVVPVPDEVDAETAAAVLLQGMTAHYLTRSTFPLKSDHTCLVLAAAGGTGLLLCQMAREAGARVLGTASTDEKAARAERAGAEHVIRYDQVDFADEVRELTDGRGVDVVYDSVGRATFMRSLDALTRRGTLVLFGASSGAVEPFDPQTLNRKGSLFLTRPSLFHYVDTRAALLERARDVLGWVADGSVQVSIDSRRPLAEAADAHRRLESRASSGKLLLQPQG